MTAVNGDVLTASQFNRYVRDNLNETAVAKATTAGQYFVATSGTSVAPRKCVSSKVYFGEGLSYIDSTQDHSGNFVDLGRYSGPSVSCTTGTSALVMISAMMDNSIANVLTAVGYTVSGATTIAANANKGVGQDGMVSDTTGSQPNLVRLGGMFHESGTLTPGTNVFTMKYLNSTNASATAYFDRREIVVWPL